MPEVDTERFLKDLYDLRQIGAFKTGVHRPTYSHDDMRARAWLQDRMRDVGLEPSTDGIGNVFGHHPHPGPHILSGSHIESQNEAGWLDGALGVVAALALARAGLPVDVCAYADEEGHFEGGFLGSRSLIGDLSDAEIDRSRSRSDGKPLRQALAEAGLAGRARLRLDPARYKGSFELHIEQGTQLERNGHRIGVVSGIVAIWQYRIVIEGQQDHAGGTTMGERRDAGLTAVRLLAAVDREFPRVCGERTVWTAGDIRLQPGAPSIIPGRAEILFQFRDLSIRILERLEETLRALVWESNRRERCMASLQTVSRSAPALCDLQIMEALAAAAEARAPGQWQTMPSGAGHDSQYIARVMPAAMLFTPSIGGISHHWTEDTKPEDLALACQVLADGVARFLGVDNPTSDQG